jgi:hypothetical protein
MLALAAVGVPAALVVRLVTIGATLLFARLAYLAYVLVLGVLLLIWLGGTT